MSDDLRMDPTMIEPSNKLGHFNMATVRDSMGTYSGDEKEDVEAWLRKGELARQVVGCSAAELLKVAILSLRGDALEWIATMSEGLVPTAWERFKEEIKGRFVSQRGITRLVSDFLVGRQRKRTRLTCLC